MADGLCLRVVRALVIRTAGTNCDAEMVRGFERAGAEVVVEHVDRLAAEPSRLDAFDLIGLPGGFSYGDDVASGRILAVRLRERLYPALRSAVERGCAVIGVCNGFQALVQAGLLPGPAAGEPWPTRAPEPQLALVANSGGRFVDRWVPVEFEPRSVCVWTEGMWEQPWDRSVVQLPVAHGEGRLVTSRPALLDELAEAGQIVLRYGEDVNGSMGRVAGVCDASGLVFGLMPHPERYLDWTRHPYWTRLGAAQRQGDAPGLQIFRNAVRAVEGATAV